MPVMQSQGIGFLDGKALIEMNNLAVGYFPSDTPEIGVYPPPTNPGITLLPDQSPAAEPQQQQEQHLGTSS